MRLFAETHGPARSADSMRPTEFALGLLREAGLSDRDTAQAFHAFGGYIQGFVMMEQGSIAGGITRSIRPRTRSSRPSCPTSSRCSRAVACLTSPSATPTSSSSSVST